MTGNKVEEKEGAGSGMILEMGFKLGAQGYWHRFGLVFYLFFFHLDLIHCAASNHFVCIESYVYSTYLLILVDWRRDKLVSA